MRGAANLIVEARAALLEVAMTSAGFILNPASQQPGAWVSPRGVPVDLMVPEYLAGSGGRRGVRIPPHAKRSARRAAGLEAALIDQSSMTVDSLDGDGRSAVINVAGSAALLVSKLHKLGERVEAPDRLNDKDAHDVYRLLVATETSDLAKTIRRLDAEEVSHGATRQALSYLESLFASPECSRCHDGRTRRGRRRPARDGFRFGPTPLTGPFRSLGVINRRGLGQAVGHGPAWHAA